MREHVLDPLLQKLALLESENEGLKAKLAERGFGLQVQNAALREQLEAARAEIAHQQEALDNFCRETLAAAQARDRAEADALEHQKVRDEAVRERESMREQFDPLAKARAEADAREAEARRALEQWRRDAENLSRQLETALKEKAEAVDRAVLELRLREEAAAESRRRETELNGKLEGSLAEQGALLQEAEDRRRVLAAMEAQLQLERQAVEELKSQAAGQARRVDELLAEREVLRFSAENDRRAADALRAQIELERREASDVFARSSADAQALREALADREALLAKAENELHALREAGTRMEADVRRLQDAVAERDALASRVGLARDAILKAEQSLRELKERGDADAAALQRKLDAATAAFQEKIDGATAALQAKLDAAVAEREALWGQLEAERQARRAERAEAAAKPAEEVVLPVEGLLDPVWAKVLPALRRSVAASFARLRQLPLGSIPEGPRAMIRMAAVSLTQTSDMLKTLQEYFDESGAPPAPGRADVPIEAALAAWEAPLRQRKIVVQRRVDVGLPKVLVDEEALRVAVFQVIRNAYDAMPRGGTLSVHVGRDSATGGVLARFSDNGPGFSAQALSTLFAPFAGPRPGHLGLGLSLARRILRRFGGDAEAANAAAPAKGAVVVLRLVPPDQSPSLGGDVPAPTP